MDVNYWYSIDTKWLAFYFLDRHIFTDEKYLSFLKIYSISNERYDLMLFGTSLMLLNNVYRLKEEKNTMDGLCLPEMSYIISFNRIDIDGRFCPYLSRTNDEVNVAHLISLITLFNDNNCVYIYVFTCAFLCCRRISFFSNDKEVSHQLYLNHSEYMNVYTCTHT